MKAVITILIGLSLSIAQSIQISIDRNKILEGDMLTLSIEVTGGEEFAQVDLGPLEKDFDIISGPSQQTNIQWINGRMASTKTLTWTLSPIRSGKFSIPPLSGTVGNRSFKGKSIPIEVMKTGDLQQNTVFIVAELDKEKVCIGEQVTLTYKLYKEPNVNIAGIDQFKMPDFKGFWAEEIYTPQQLKFQAQEEVINGVKYQVANLGQRALFPISSDEHKIPSISLKVQLEVKKKKRRRDPFFDPFFDSFFSETKTKILRSKEKTLFIESFPEPRPFDFTGAVGDFQMNAEVDRLDGKVNEGLSFTISLKGTGNIGLFSLPDIKFPDGVEAFPPSDSFDKDGFRNKLTGIQKWEYILIPRQAGVIVIPRVQMSFYDPNIKSWKRISTDPIQLSIAPSEIDNVYNGSLTKREVELLGQDIRFISTDTKISPSKNSNKTTLIILIYISSVIMFISPLLLSKFMGYRIATESNRQVRGALRKSIKTLRSINHDPFETASRAFYEYLKDKCSLKTNNLDPASVEMILNNRLEQKIIDRVKEILTVCDAGKYSPDAIKREGTIKKEMLEIIKQVDKDLS